MATNIKDKLTHAMLASPLSFFAQSAYGEGNYSSDTYNGSAVADGGTSVLPDVLPNTGSELFMLIGGLAAIYTSFVLYRRLAKQQA